MPRGIFLVIHDEIMGPQIKCSYYTKPMALSKEFISKLYMSHAGFDSSSHIEIKFDDFKSISCFTGNLDRRTKKEGILGILFEEEEEYDNLDPFLQRNLYKIIEDPTNETIKAIFTYDLSNYLELTSIFNKVDLEGIQEIYIINGNEEFKSYFIKVSEKNVSRSEMAELYNQINESQKIPHYQYDKLNIDSDQNIFLVIKGNCETEFKEKIIQVIKSYLERSIEYCLEILALSLIPSIIKITTLNQTTSKDDLGKHKSVLQMLQQSKNYFEDFNQIISDVRRGDLYLIPIL